MSGGDWKEMYVAVQRGDLELVKYHIKNGIDPNYQHPEILSLPLVTAIIEGHIEIAMFLLESGADVTITSYYDNMNAIQAANEYKRNELIEIIGQKTPKKKSLLDKIISKFK